MLVGDWYFERSNGAPPICHATPTLTASTRDRFRARRRPHPARRPRPADTARRSLRRTACSGLSKEKCDAYVHKHQLDLFAAGCESGEARALSTARWWDGRAVPHGVNSRSTARKFVLDIECIHV